MARRLTVLVACGFIAVLLAVHLPIGLVFPQGSLLATVSGERIPDSSVTPLPEFTRNQTIWIEYRANGTAGQSGVFWTELYYRIADETNWTLYRPPWNPDGRWYGALGFSTDALVEGRIPFDTFFAGGEATYEFSTVAVDRGFWREPGPEKAKVRTTLDTRPPQVFIASPAPDAWTRENVLRWVATDEVSGLASVDAVLDKDPALSFAVEPGSKKASGSAAMALTAEGDHGVAVRAVDRAGNPADVFVPFHFDPNAPTLRITAPARDSFVNSRDVNVTWTAGDSASGVASLQLAVDAAAPVNLTGSVRSHRLTNLAERGHTVILVAFDAAGNFASETVTFGVDVTPPTLQLVAPQPDSYSNARDLQVLWVGSDAVSGIDHFELRLVETNRQSPPIPSAVGFTFEAVAQGVHTVRILAVDRANNSVEAEARVTVDFTAPTVSITAPASGKTVYGTVQVNWSASDDLSGIARVEFIYDGGTPIVATGAASHGLADPGAVGPHFAAVRVWDRAGNMAEAGVPFEYGGAAAPAPRPFEIPALDFWIIMAIIGAIAVISAYYMVRRRKKAQA